MQQQIALEMHTTFTEKDSFNEDMIMIIESTILLLGRVPISNWAWRIRHQGRIPTPFLTRLRLN